MPKDSFHASLADLPKESMFDGRVKRVAFLTDNAISVVIWNDTIGQPPPFVHAHPFDQLTYVIQGTLLMTVGEDEFEVGPNGVVYIPANVVHGGSVVGDTPALMIDVFSPIREDYRYLAAAQLGLDEIGEPPDGNPSNVVDHLKEFLEKGGQRNSS